MIQAYDVVIVGAGTAGQTAAYDLKAAGLNVAVVEKSPKPGGVCALSGCQSKKWFYEAAETIAKCRHLAGKGIAEPPCGSWPQVLREKNQFTSAVPGNTVKGFQQAGIDYVEGEARFQDGNALVVDGKRHHAGFFIIAVGAKPMPLSFPGSDLLMTSDDWLEQADLPERIVFVGGGFIAFEFAHFAARLGPPGCRPIILEAAERPLRPFDAEMVDLLLDASAEAGIEIHAGSQITGIRKVDRSFRVHTGAGHVFEADQVVHGAGRVPAIDDLGLDSAGIAFNRAGIVVDEHMRTSNAKVFAIGDCAATIQLARVADDEGHTAARAILSELGKGQPTAIGYGAVPSVLFTCPQLGMVGKTEQGLLQEGVSYNKSFAKNLGWPTYRRVGLRHAAYKILTDDNGRLLGAHFLSDNACGMLNAVRLAMLNGITVDRLYRQSITGPYPSRESDLIYMLKPLLSGLPEA
ncbi:dihydrolipoyl dehydrogenase family protein [Desulfatirhabdium butyrativorans]|uniref:dihydrolipoyl dehydrogenase family protein n=1 Tax=Desulfatirhabdium butyrativorans TaxID=340467 RepID=UPI0005506033|nr:NAD(P)/FAD-dependent oxidoreductase [Desulfatirhabdium butyrativorans]